MGSFIPRNRNISRRFYQEVDPSTVVKDDYIPADGEVLEIVNFGGNGAYDMSIHVEIIWDADTVNAQTLLSTHGDALHEDVTNIELVGDGVKKLQIKLANHTLGDAHPIGAFWEAEKR